MTTDAADRLAQIAARAEAALAETGPFAHRVAFDFGADGGFTVDGPGRRVILALAPADATVALTLDDFVAVAKGERDPALLFLRQRIRIEGRSEAALDLVRRLKSAN